MLLHSYFFSSFNEASAQGIEGKWGVGLRGGGAFLSQDLSDDFKSKTGPIISGNLLYGLTNVLSVGFEIGWEKHRTEVIGRNIGDATTVSLLPFVEFRTIALGALSSYLSLGLGLNINSFNRQTPLAQITENLTAEEIASLEDLTLNKIDRADTLAARISVGGDYFITQSLAVNTEAGWKFKSGKVDICSPFANCRTEDWNASIFTALLGLRYYF